MRRLDLSGEMGWRSPSMGVKRLEFGEKVVGEVLGPKW